MDIKIDLNELRKMNVCESLKFGLNRLVPQRYLNVDPDKLIKYPRIQKCIAFIKKGLKSLPFNGYNSLEAINKICAAHFLNHDNIYFQQCCGHIYKIITGQQLYFDIKKVGWILDDYQFGGSIIIRAACLARSQRVTETKIKQEISESVEKFTQILDVQDKHDLIVRKQNKWILRIPILPIYYHLMLLANTFSWPVVKFSDRLSSMLLQNSFC